VPVAGGVERVVNAPTERVYGRRAPAARSNSATRAARSCSANVGAATALIASASATIAATVS
jgi:hypothetical protein